MKQKIEMNNIIRNTYFDNLVNYVTKQSSVSAPHSFNYNSIEPTCLSNLLKDQDIIEYHFAKTVKKQIIEDDDQFFED